MGDMCEPAIGAPRPRALYCSPRSVVSRQFGISPAQYAAAVESFVAARKARAETEVAELDWDEVLARTRRLLDQIYEDEPPLGQGAVAAADNEPLPNAPAAGQAWG